MRKLFLGVSFSILFFAGCSGDLDSSQKQVLRDLNRQLDSVHALVVENNAMCDSLLKENNSLRIKYREQRIAIRLTAMQCKKYASIVRDEPAQSKFIVGWTNRAFNWIDENGNSKQQ